MTCFRGTVNMSGAWARRAVAVIKKRAMRLIRWCGLWPETEADRRRRLVEEGRRNPALSISAHVEELSARSAGHEAFHNPSILILQLAHIGDFVLSLRAAKKLREGFRQSPITLVCASWNVEWAKQTGFFDRVVPFDFFSRLNQHWNGATPDIFTRFEELSLGAFDIAIDLRHDADTRPCLYRAKARARVGYMAPIERGYPPLDLMLPPVERLPLSNGSEYSLHAELRLELLADAVLDAYANSAGSHPVALLADSAAERALRPYFILAVGAGDSIRRWPTQKFVELAQKLIDKFAWDVWVVGGAAERPIVEAILAELPATRAIACVDLPLTDLAARVAQASLLVGLGSGVTHLAATLGVSTVSILSGVSPLDVWRPVGTRVVNLVGKTPCAPCGLKHELECPFGVACLTAITPDHVLAAAERVMQRAPASPRHSDRPPESARGLAQYGERKS